MEIDKTFVAGFLCVVVIALSLIGGVTYANINKYHAMQEMVSKGANPQAVACAVNGVDSMNQQVCTALAINSNKVN